MNKIKISSAKELAEEYEMEVIVIIAMDNNGMQNVVTFGMNPSSSKYAADLGNRLKELLGWSEKDCHAQPLERICNNCDYFKKHEKQYDIPDIDKIGDCNIEPKSVIVTWGRIACKYFAGKNWRD